MLEVTEGNKDELANLQGRYSPTETVDDSGVFTREIGEPGDAWRREKSWAVTDPGPDSLWSSWKVEVCERGRALLRRGRLEQEEFVKIFKKGFRWLFRELDHSSRPPPPRLCPHSPCGLG